MCGIAGILSCRPGKSVDREELTRISEHMKSRGPDDSGTWYSPNYGVGLAHRRLAIIDPSPSGHQPMVRDHSVIIFNGEIYNFRSLRGSLERSGHQFASESDTEVLLALYQKKGKDMVNDLIGMYAFAIWDEEKGSLFLARDPYGIKPLYYSFDDGVFRFASQVKSLLRGGGISQEFDPVGEVAFLMLGSVPEPGTFFTAVSALPAGAWIEVTHSGPGQPREFCTIAGVWEAHMSGKSENKSVSIAEAFRESVQRHLVSDVPVGLFLSAGMDSGAIAGVMSELEAGSLQSVNIGFDELTGREQDERPLASEISAYYGLQHTNRTVSKIEFDADLTDFLGAMDQPSIDGLNTWFASKAAAEAGLKVVMSGVGGDEIFGSYPAFQRIPQWTRQLQWAHAMPRLGELLISSRHIFSNRYTHPKFWGMLKYGHSVPGAYLLNRGIFMPWELPAVMCPDRLQYALDHFDIIDLLATQIPNGRRVEGERRGGWMYASISTLESVMYMKNQLLRDTDWASMAHSVEVRTPLVDIAFFASVVGSLLNDPINRSKAAIANAPKKAMPQVVQNRPKTGFSTPVDQWLESTPALDIWKKVPVLRASAGSWARRYAYAIKEIALGQ